MRLTKQGLIFTSGERVVLAIAASWKGLRGMVDRTGFWSNKRLPSLPKSVPLTAERLLLWFGDLKMDPDKINDACSWAMEAVDEDAFAL